MDSKAKVTKTQINTLVNDDGEIIQQNKHETFLIDREPPYVKIYIEDIGKLNGISTTKNKILYAFIKSMGYSNIIPAYKPIKQLMARDLGVSLNTVEAAVKEFKKKGLFISIARGMYMADPELFGRGKWSDIKDLRLTIEYSENGGKKLKSNLPEQLKLNLGI